MSTFRNSLLNIFSSNAIQNVEGKQKRGFFSSTKKKTKIRFALMCKYLCEMKESYGTQEMLELGGGFIPEKSFYRLMDELIERQKLIGDESRNLLEKIDHSGEKIQTQYRLTEYGRQVAFRIARRA